MMNAAPEAALSSTARPAAPADARPPRLGIIGGGQLARMTAKCALQLGCDVIVLERSPASPAATLATHSLVGDWNQLGPLRDLASRVDLVTLENEFVDASLLAALEHDGVTVLPGSRCMTLVQDKFIQKQTLAAAGLPVPKLRAVASLAEAAGAVRDFGLPLLLKARRNGYDGKGNFTVRTEADVARGWEALGGPRGNELFVEAFCAFERELAIIITLGRDGSAVAYPVVETVQREHICHIVRAPADVTPAVARRAVEVAQRAVQAVGAVGSFGVELFLTADGRIFINELAPRVHNSGHYTIEACDCSQFENHIRAMLGWPLGSPRMVAPAAVMVNLLGAGPGPGQPEGIAAALAVPGAHLHLYGKTRSERGRKLGHVTALGETLAAAEATSLRAARELQFGQGT